jgi:hypothetical protein
VPSVWTEQQVKEKAACEKLLPTEKDFAGRPGYSRKYRPDGTYEWKYSYRPNVDGKLTKEGGEVIERMKNFTRADSERHLKNQKKVDRAKMKDKDGGVRFVEASLADEAARRNGWSHALSGRRCRIETGPDGMLFKLEPRGWRPLGRWCLSRPFSQGKRPETGRKDGTMRPVGVQLDPDGTARRFHQTAVENLMTSYNLTPKQAMAQANRRYQPGESGRPYPYMPPNTHLTTRDNGEQVAVDLQRGVEWRWDAGSQKWVQKPHVSPTANASAAAAPSSSTLGSAIQGAFNWGNQPLWQMPGSDWLNKPLFG